VTRGFHARLAVNRALLPRDGRISGTPLPDVSPEHIEKTKDVTRFSKRGSPDHRTYLSVRSIECPGEVACRQAAHRTRRYGVRGPFVHAVSGVLLFLFGVRGGVLGGAEHRRVTAIVLTISGDRGVESAISASHCLYRLRPALQDAATLRS